MAFFATIAQRSETMASTADEMVRWLRGLPQARDPDRVQFASTPLRSHEPGFGGCKLHVQLGHREGQNTVFASPTDTLIDRFESPGKDRVQSAKSSSFSKRLISGSCQGLRLAKVDT
jgi:hypothetical protein